MDNELKKKLLKYKGTVSEEEIDYIKSLLPKTNSSLNMLKSIAGSALSNNEMEYIKKMLPKKGIR